MTMRTRILVQDIGLGNPKFQRFASPISIWACYDKERKEHKEYGYGHSIFWCSLHITILHTRWCSAIEEHDAFLIAYGMWVLFVCFLCSPTSTSCVLHNKTCVLYLVNLQRSIDKNWIEK